MANINNIVSEKYRVAILMLKQLRVFILMRKMYVQKKQVLEIKWGNIKIIIVFELSIYL